MEKPPVDYKAVLDDLKGKRIGIDAAIKAVEQILGQAPSAAAEVAASIDGSAPLRSDTFFGMGIGDAAVKYLTLTKAPRSTNAIMKALEEGGLTHTSKNFYGTVFTALKRRSEIEEDVTKVKKEWGLSAWYPGMRKTKKNGEKAEPATAETAKA
jgi:hypothetical protein